MNTQAKFKKHTDGWFKAIILMFVASLLANSVSTNLSKLSDYKERTAPTSDWYEYVEGREVVPKQEVFEVGTYPEFHSNLEYFQAVDMRWDDTLWCDNKKFKTQRWEQYIPKAKVVSEDDGKTWSYKEEIVKEPKQHCVICSAVIGFTNNRYPKTTGLCSLPFSFDYLEDIKPKL